MEQINFDFNESMWIVYNQFYSMEINSTSRLEAVMNFIKSFRQMPKVVVGSDGSCLKVIDECNQCNDIIFEDEEYGYCEDDQIYLCEKCMMIIPENKNE